MIFHHKYVLQQIRKRAVTFCEPLMGFTKIYKLYFAGNLRKTVYMYIVRGNGCYFSVLLQCQRPFILSQKMDSSTMKGIITQDSLRRVHISKDRTQCGE